MKIQVKHIALLAIAVLYFCAGFSQTSWIDSVKKSLAEQQPDSNKVFALLGLSDHYKLYYPDSSLVYGYQALALSQKLKNDRWMFWSEVEITDALVFLGNYPLELEHCFKSAELAGKIKEPYITGFADGMFSNYYENVGEYNTSLAYYRKVMQGAAKLFPDDISIVCANFSRIFENMDEKDSALVYALKAYEGLRHNKNIHAENSGGGFERCHISLALGNAFAGKSKYDSALFYYRESIRYSILLNLEIDLLDNYNGIAAIYRQKGQTDSAIWYAKTSATARIGKSYLTGLLKATTMLADMYSEQQKNDSALKYLRISIGIKDSLFNREKMNAIKNLTAVQQDKQNEIAAAKTKLRNQYMLYFLLTLFVMILLAAIVITRNKKHKQLQRIRNNIAADLHDDIGSTLTHISILSELSRRSIHVENEATQFLSRLDEQIYSTGQALDDIIWSVNVQNDSVEEMLVRMRRVTGELLEAAGINYTLDTDSNLSGLKICMEQRHDLYLIFKEALNNICKHADASLVTIHFYRDGQHIIMHIEDNGRGITGQNMHRNGLKNMRTRARKWGGDLNIGPGKNSGTLLQLKLPAKK